MVCSFYLVLASDVLEKLHIYLINISLTGCKDGNAAIKRVCVCVWDVRFADDQGKLANVENNI